MYRKSLEGKERLHYEKKRKIREALKGSFFSSSLLLISLFFFFKILFIIIFFCFAEGKPIPTELRNEEAALRREIDLEDENLAGILFFLLSDF